MDALAEDRAAKTVIFSIFHPLALVCTVRMWEKVQAQYVRSNSRERPKSFGEPSEAASHQRRRPLRLLESREKARPAGSGSHQNDNPDWRPLGAARRRRPRAGSWALYYGMPGPGGRGGSLRPNRGRPSDGVRVNSTGPAQPGSDSDQGTFGT
jgi:hypothetical protein